MNALPLPLRRSACLLTCVGLAATAGRLAAADPAAPDPFQANTSYIRISGQVTDVSGNKAAYSERAQTDSNGAVGIEALHLERELDKTTTMQLDGHALTGSADYLGKLRFERTDVGSFEIGYKRFRTFYDGIGGFFPLNSYWNPLTKEELHADRGAFWADLKIALPNAPVFHLRYSDELRTGQKDSTIWGDTDFTGIPIYNKSALNPYSAARKLVPSYVDLDEHRKTYEASVTHTIGKTSLELSVVRAETDNNDTRWLDRYPGELKPFPAISTSASGPTILIPPEKANNAIHGFDQQMVKSTATTYTGKFETRFSEKVALFGGISYLDYSADVAADREMTVSIQTGTGVVSTIGGFSPGGGTSGPGRPPYSYQMSDGRVSHTVFSGNLGLKLEPSKDLFVTLALKGEKTDTDGHNTVNFINTKVVLASGATTSVPVVVPNTSTLNETAWTPEIDVRYSGIRNFTPYANFDYRHTSGDEISSNGALGSTGTGAAGTWIAGPAVVSEDNTGENHGHYKVGANWNVCQAFTLRGEVFYRDHRNSFTDIGSSTDGFVMGYRFRGVKITGIVKPLPGLTLTSRYVGQSGEADVVVDSGTSYDSMDSQSDLFGETIDWAPTKEVYFQANFNIVFASISTAYPRAGGSANDVLRNADNNYWNGSFVAGFVAGPTTNVELQARIYRSNNYNPAMVVSIPYGAEAKESSVTLAIKQKFSDRLRGTAKVGYFESHNITTGGFTNYHGPMGYLSLEYSL